MREDDLHVGEVLHPRWVPLQRHEAVVVNGGQGANNLVDGRAALANQVEAAVVVGIAHVDVLDVGTQVLDSLSRGLATGAIDVVDIPQSAQVVAGVAVHDSCHARGAGKDAAGLDQQNDAVCLGIRHKLTQGSVDGTLVIVLDNDDDLLDAGGSGEVDELLGDLNLLLTCGDVDRGVERRDAQALVAQGARRRLAVVAVKRAALAGEDGVDYGIVDLDAGEIHLEGGAYQLVPGVVSPAAGRKGKLH